MSSFSSLVRKPGKVVPPKAAPRRNIPRRAPAVASEQVNTAAELNNEPSSTSATQEGTHSTPQVIDEVETAPNNSANVIENEIQHLAEASTVEKNNALNREQVTQPQQSGLPPPRRTSPSSTVPVERSEATSNPVPTSSAEFQQPRSPYLQPASNLSSEPEQRHEQNADRVPSITPNPGQFASELIVSITDPGRPSVQTDTVAQEEVRNGGRPQKEPGSEIFDHRPEPVRPRSKRKAPPRASASLILAQPASTHTPALARAPTPHREITEPIRERAPSVTSQSSEHAEAFQRIATRLHSGFEPLRASQTPSRAPSVLTAAAAADGDTTTTTSARKRRKRNNNNPPQTIEEQAAEVVANATGNEDLAPRRRRGTPEDAEEHEIQLETIKLGELCDDHKWGKKSSVEKEMAANWPEILRRRKRENEERLEKAAEGRSRKRKDLPNQDTSVVVPQQVIVNGQIVVEERTVDNREQLVREANEEDGQVLEVRDIFTRVTQDSIAPKKRIPPGQVWDDVNTDLFYQGLRMFGTDFKMISNMISGKDRRQVKLKYNAEERSNWNRVKRALNGKEDVTLDQYSSMTGIEFTNVEDVYKQMEEEEKKIRADDEERRRNEGIISQQANGGDANADGQADIAMPSIEGQEGEQQAADGNQLPSDRASTAATTAGRQTAQPSNKKKQTRKTNPNSKRGRQAANKRGGFEGFEERLGGTDEVAIPSN